MTVPISNFAAELERAKASQRTRDALQHKAQRGFVAGGTVFGYRNVPVAGDGGLRSHVIREVREDEAAIVRRIFELAGQVRGGLGRRVEAAAGAGGREREAQADVRRARPRERGDQGCPEPKAVTPSAKREVLAVLVQEHGVPVRRACQAVRLSRAAYYRPPRSRLAQDADVVTALNEVVGRHTRWGFWKCFYRLRRAGHQWNHKRIHRVYCALRLNLPRRTKRRVPARLRQPLVAPARLNEIWALDFMADALYDGRGFRTFNVLDEGNREALAIEIGTSIPSARVIRVLDDLIRLYGRPARLRVDNGPELTAEAFVDWCAAQRIAIGYIQPGKPDQNAFIERFNRSFREEVLDAYLFDSLEQVCEITEAWLATYNTERPHDSLGQVPPLTFLPRPDAPVESNSGDPVSGISAAVGRRNHLQANGPLAFRFQITV